MDIDYIFASSGDVQLPYLEHNHFIILYVAGDDRGHNAANAY